MKAAALAVAASLAWGTTALAHHSFLAQYDSARPIELKGVVTMVEWTNPHARFYVDVKDEQGQVRNWNFELASPNVLVRNGWSRTTLKAGDSVSVKGFVARVSPPDGPQMAIASTIIGPDGKQVFASAPQDLAR
jgi:hypothetical protein